MQIILLERVGKLGAMGEVVKVKDGYARNFLLPNLKALRATDANRAKFERDRSVIEARNVQTRQAAADEAAKIEGKVFVIIRQAGESGQLYGSVSLRDIAEAARAKGIVIDKNHVHVAATIKSIGMYDVELSPHAEVTVAFKVNVARTPSEAEAQGRGEVLDDAAAEKAETRAAAQALFDQAQADEQAEEDAEPGIQTAAERKASKAKKS